MTIIKVVGSIILILIGISALRVAVEGILSYRQTGDPWLAKCLRDPTRVPLVLLIGLALIGGGIYLIFKTFV
jgi:hypothetical protein